ncbi:flagellar biosynthesis anti-sigma factor FlgM [Hydrogenophaga sp. T2]|uniref:flagellar biosynthesis anti-sigma factor FlgM n=1 Tax=Hydrogenophaga sp. T2 TaxID=3132823 RepID=UPI003CF23F22
MKVDSSSADSYIGSVAGGPHKAATPPAAAVEGAAKGPSNPQPGVTLTLSSSATVGASGSEVFNSEKVEAMKQAIAAGTFQVNPEAIADKLLSNAAEMLNAARA